MSDLAKSRGILEHCATNQAAHFGGPHGIFVDVPVAHLVALLNGHKDADDEVAEAIYHLRKLFPVITPSSRFANTDDVPRSYLRQPNVGEVRKIAAFLDRNDPAKGGADEQAYLGPAAPLGHGDAVPYGIGRIWQQALSSIARNTCCDACQEAALVAQHALSAASPQLIADLLEASDDDLPR